MKELLPLASGLIGIFLGGLIQYLLGRRAERGKAFDKLQSDAYVDFMKSIAGVAMAQRFKDANAEIAATTLLVDAKVRIGIYGDRSISHAVGEFFERYGDLSKEEDMRALVDLMHKMRTAVIGKANVEDMHDLSRILFSRDLLS